MSPKRFVSKWLLQRIFFLLILDEELNRHFVGVEYVDKTDWALEDDVAVHFVELIEEEAHKLFETVVLPKKNTKMID